MKIRRNFFFVVILMLVRSPFIKQPKTKIEKGEFSFTISEFMAFEDSYKGFKSRISNKGVRSETIWKVRFYTERSLCVPV